MEAAAGLAINSAGAFHSPGGVCLLFKQACLVVPRNGDSSKSGNPGLPRAEVAI